MLYNICLQFILCACFCYACVCVCVCVETGRFGWCWRLLWFELAWLLDAAFSYLNGIVNIAPYMTERKYPNNIIIMEWNRQKRSSMDAFNVGLFLSVWVVVPGFFVAVGVVVLQNNQRFTHSSCACEYFWTFNTRKYTSGYAFKITPSSSPSLVMWMAEDSDSASACFASIGVVVVIWKALHVICCCCKFNRYHHNNFG